MAAVSIIISRTRKKGSMFLELLLIFTPKKAPKYCPTAREIPRGQFTFPPMVKMITAGMLKSMMMKIFRGLSSFKDFPDTICKIVNKKIPVAT